jgi:cell wall-associated NlpC family hydrolase
VKTLICSVIVVALTTAATLADSTAWAATRHASADHASADLGIAAYARTFPGHYRYAYGGNSPGTGFDCSGLAQYVYHRFHKRIPRTSQRQFRFFRRETRREARPGDLVFFHVTSSRTSSVYHVGIYEGHHAIVAAADAQDGIVYERIWSSDVTYGTITH